MILLPVKCPVCNGIDVTKHGTTSNGKQRFICKDPVCEGKTFILDYSAKGRLPETKQQIVEMTLNGSSIRDTARVLEISPTTVINELKKGPELQAVNHDFLALHRHDQIVVDIVKVEDNSDVSRQDTRVEMDEMWSYVGCKDNQRWLWHTVDRITGKVLAYVLGDVAMRFFSNQKIY